jgi:TolB-like protein/Flp pilus assembly protein TadD
LEKNQDERLGDIADAAIEISETLSKPATIEVTMPTKLRRMAMIIGAVVIGIILLGIALKYIPQTEIQPSSKEIRLVVLSFENLGPAEDEYFAKGITEEITTRLAGIHGLGVISRQSAIQYKNREKSTLQIAQELDVDYILEGTVQRERPSDPNSWVRIRSQLIRVDDDIHIWAQTYDNDMSEVFQLQSDIAEQVAQGLNITLLEPERQALASRPTENIDAYEYYLRGNEYFSRSFLENDFRIALQMYKKAVELDPNFALAYAQLSRAHVVLYWLYYERSEERLALAKQAVDKALQLNPDLPEVRLALGIYYYHGHLDYDRALEQFAIARKSQPNNSEFMSFTGFVQRRQGKFEQALANIRKASELDPRSETLAHNLADTFFSLRKYPETELYYDRAISVAPDTPLNYHEKALLYLCWEGSTEKARAVLEEGLDNIKSAENPGIVNSLVNIDVFEGNYQEALTQLSSWTLESFDMYFYFIPKALLNAQINGLMGNRQLEQDYYESARSILESQIEEQLEDARFHSSLGIAYAGLGRKEDALREGKLGVKLQPVSKDAVSGLPRVEDLARIYVMVGEFDAAIDQLEFLLSKPGWMSIPLLRLDPAWAPLRDHPRFKKLLEADK